MILILEGPDGTFKTTLAQKLANAFEFPYLHGSSFESALLDQDLLFQWYVDLLSKYDDVIMDRSFYSNRVYAGLNRKYTLLSDKQVVELEDLIRSKHPYHLVIHCTAPTEVLVKRVAYRGDKDIEPDFAKLSAISDKYYEVMFGECSLPILWYNTVNMPPDDFLIYALKIISSGIDLFPKDVINEVGEKMEVELTPEQQNNLIFGQTEEESQNG